MPHMAWPGLQPMRQPCANSRHFAARLEADGKLGETEQLTIQIAAGEYLNHVAGGIPMNQGEFLRLAELGLTRGETAGLHDLVLFERGNTPAARRRLVELFADGNFGSSGLDETLSEMRETMRRFVETKVGPNAHQWHLDNDYVPIEIVAELAELGVFALTLPEEHGGLGLSKESMCVVSEELSRGWIAVGSLGTRAEIACELILCGGTREQKEKWLPKIAHRRDPADRRLHRAQYRLRPWEPAHPRGARRRHLQRDRQQDLDHPSRPRRRDDAAGPHRPGRDGLQGPLHVHRRKAARHRRQSLPREGHERRRDRGAGLSRHEGIRDPLRGFRGEGGEPAGRHRGPGLQAADADLRGGAHPDRGARRRRGAECARPRPEVCQATARSSASRSSPSRASPTSWR